MAKVVRDKSGQTIIIGDDGVRRPATSGDLDDLTITNPDIVSKQQGVENFERWNMKNFAANPGKAKNYLRSLGYEVANFGSGFNFAVRMPGEQAWKVVDPPLGHGGVGEFVKDMTDLTSDVLGGFLTGAATTAGAVGGIPGAAAAGAGAGAATEAGRQGIGSALGIPDNTDAGQIATVGALSGALPVAGAGLRAAGRQASQFIGKAGVEVPQALRTLGARVAGIRDQPGMDAGEILARRAAIKPGEVIQSPTDFLAQVRAKFDHLSGRVIPALTNETSRIINQHPEARINATGIVKLLKGQEGRLRSLADADARAEAGKILDGIESAVGADFSLVPAGIQMGRKEGRSVILNARQADTLKRSLQELVDASRGYEGRPGDEKVTSLLRSAARTLRVKMEDALGGKTGQFAKANAEASRIIESRDAMRDMFGSHIKSAESNVLNLVGKGKSEARQIVRDFDEINGTNFENLAQQAQVGYAFNPTEGTDFGKPELIGRITATGNVLGGGLIGGGAVAGGPLGALGGAGIYGTGVLAAGPRAMVAYTRGAQAASQIAKDVSARLGPGFGRLSKVMTLGMLPESQRSAAIAAFTQGMARILPTKTEGKAVIRQDAKRKELEGR